MFGASVHALATVAERSGSGDTPMLAKEGVVVVVMVSKRTQF